MTESSSRKEVSYPFHNWFVLSLIESLDVALFLRVISFRETP